MDDITHNLTNEQRIKIREKVFGEKANAPMSMPLSASAFRALREGKRVIIKELIEEDEDAASTQEPSETIEKGTDSA